MTAAEAQVKLEAWATATEAKRRKEDDDIDEVIETLRRAAWEPEIARRAIANRSR